MSRKSKRTSFSLSSRAKSRAKGSSSSAGLAPVFGAVDREDDLPPPDLEEDLEPEGDFELEDLEPEGLPDRAGEVLVLTVEVL